MTARTSAQRSRARYHRAYGIVGPVTLDKPTNLRLQFILKKTREPVAILVRRLITEEYERI